ncbi:ParB/RepB/Spo0J family partition protein [Actinomyces sp. B33]|uniref:ParB/RepB/Spo0J family partition protein n=1 Tax=Actinomyces sp. B33 TaxID=2942131 RepID=UPI0023421344|nr:ParB/RepB/Spo0J family partition protein [Actinomyces sp. B33]MDC4232537.1 ParB/RepB/Spo0J family partition protein [Actinomyces sp. B33]
MTAEKSKATAGRKAGRHAGLGRGLGALIPAQSDAVASDEGRSAVDPLDVFFPDRSGTAGRRTRGGSAKELLIPHKRDTSSAGEPEEKTSTRARKSSPSSSAARTRASRRGTKAEGSTTKRTSRSSSREFDSTGTDAPKTTAVRDTDPTRVVSESEADVSRETSTLVSVPGAVFAVIDIDSIIPNTRQPREIFDEDDLAELAASIREVGVLQPIVVREIPSSIEPGSALEEALKNNPEATYELIMGERRTRASELAGETTIPAIIRDTEDEDLLRDALLENLHRAQLNPLEEASAYQQLMADFGATQEELSQRIARSRPQIANTLRLLKLPPAVQKKVAAQVISAGHARALLSLSSAEDMERLAERIIAEGLSVRTTEELVRLGRVKAPTSARTRRSPIISALGESVVDAFQDAFDTRVTITEGRRKGRIVIEYAGAEDLQRIADVLTARGER